MFDIQTLLAIIGVVMVGVAGFGFARWLQHQEETAPTRTLQAIDSLLTQYERMAINSREVSEASARNAANAARFAAVSKRIATLPPVALVSVPHEVTVDVK